MALGQVHHPSVQRDMTTSVLLRPGECSYQWADGENTALLPSLAFQTPGLSIHRECDRSAPRSVAGQGPKAGTT